MDTNRPYLDAEKEFFHEFGSGDVPVIAIFTKFDGLETKAFSELRANKVDIKTAKREKKQRAIEAFTTSYVEPLKELSTRPMPWVKLDDMREESSNCAELISVTDGALSDDALKLLFVSVQQNNIDVSIKNAVRYAYDRFSVSDVVMFTLSWFPHVWKNFHYENTARTFQRTQAQQFQQAQTTIQQARTERDMFDKNEIECESIVNKYYVSKELQESARIELICAICICAEQTFSQADASGEYFTRAFEVAMEAYMNGELSGKIANKIQAKVNSQDVDTPCGGAVIALADILKAHRLRL